MKIWSNFNLKSNRAFVYSLAMFVLFTILFSYIISPSFIEAEDSSEPAFASKKDIIIIDAGHGGEDCGAIGVGNVYEKDLNMQISMKLGDYLRAAGYEVVYTRTEDCLLYTEEQNIKGMRKIYDLKNRVEISNSYSDALLVSIHMNSFGSAECRGLQVYYSPNSAASKSAAENIQKEVTEKIQTYNKRTIKPGEGLYLLENSSNPAILIECGFISNPDECKKLSEKEYQKELSFAILCGIIEYEKK